MPGYDDDVGQAEAEHWEREADREHELVISQHLQEQEDNDYDQRRAARDQD